MLYLPRAIIKNVSNRILNTCDLRHSLYYRPRSVGINYSTLAEKAKQTQDLKPYKEIPGPTSLALIGSLFSFLPGGKLAGCKGLKLNERLYELYGPIAKIDGSFGAKDTVFLFDPEAVEHVCRSEEGRPVREGTPSLEYYRKQYKESYDPEQTTGLSTEDGEKWRVLRLKANPIMLQSNIIKAFNNDLEEVSNEMIERIKAIRDEQNRIAKGLYLQINLWALESLGMVTFGTRLNCLDPNLPADSPIRKFIENVHDIFVISDKLDFTPNLWRVYSTKAFKRAMRIYEDHDNFTKYFLNQALKKMNEKKNTSADTSNDVEPILQKLLKIDSHTAEIMVTDILNAAVDTTSNTVIAILYLLALNPDKQNKLREEILAKQNQKSYLKACIKESMRILPVPNANVRVTTKEHNVLGYNIPKGVRMAFGHQFMSIMEKHYPKPNEFIPERWLVGKDHPLYRGNTNPYVMAPFGLGARMCLGRRIAELEMEMIISKVIENFQIDWTSEESIQIDHIIFNYFREPYHFVFKDL